QVADLQVFDVAALLDHFTGDFVAQHQTGLSGGTAAHHVLVGTTDVGGNHTQDDSVVNLPAARVLHFWIVDFLYFDFAIAEIHHTTIARHAFTSMLFLWSRVARYRRRVDCSGCCLYVLCCLFGPLRGQASLL